MADRTAASTSPCQNWPICRSEPSWVCKTFSSNRSLRRQRAAKKRWKHSLIASTTAPVSSRSPSGARCLSLSFSCWFCPVASPWCWTSAPWIASTTPRARPSPSTPRNKRWSLINLECVERNQVEFVIKRCKVIKWEASPHARKPNVLFAFPTWQKLQPRSEINHWTSHNNNSRDMREFLQFDFPFRRFLTSRTTGTEKEKNTSGGRRSKFE